MRSLRMFTIVLLGSSLWTVSHYTIASQGVRWMVQSTGLGHFQSETEGPAAELLGAAMVWVFDGKV